MTNRKTILLFNQSEDLLLAWEHEFSKYANVYTVNDPVLAVELYKAIQPDIFVADYCSPMEDQGYVINGARVHERRLSKKTAIFATTASIGCYSEQADSCFLLPDDLEELSRAVQNKCSSRLK